MTLCRVPRTLVLNADYMPIAACHPVRGALLVSRNKAHALEITSEVMRSERITLSLPAVIVLAQYRKVQLRPTPKPPGRQRVLMRDDYRCQYCGATATTVDHIVPRSAGGGSSWTNMVACCVACNGKKGSLSLESCGLRLRAVPVAPRPSVQEKVAFLGGWLSRRHPQVSEVWAKYLSRREPTPI